MRLIAQALIAVTLIASASNTAAGQRSNGDDESSGRDAAVASLQAVHSFSLTGRASPAFADWICAVHQANPNKSEKSQDWKVTYLANCSANSTGFAAARNGRSEGDWQIKFLATSGLGAGKYGGWGDQGENEGNESTGLISRPGEIGSSPNADGSPGGGSSGAGLSSAGVSGNTAVVTETITNPEPGTILLVSSGLAMVAAAYRRRRRS
jgi:hypothetical protein